MERINISLAAFTEHGDAAEIPKTSLPDNKPVPNYPTYMQRPTTPVDRTASLQELAKHTAQALGIGNVGSPVDNHTALQMQRLKRMSVRYENSTMPDENV